LNRRREDCEWEGWVCEREAVGAFKFLPYQLFCGRIEASHAFKSIDMVKNYLAVSLRPRVVLSIHPTPQTQPNLDWLTSNRRGTEFEERKTQVPVACAVVSFQLRL
jgi:hypothetical protein